MTSEIALIDKASDSSYVKVLYNDGFGGFGFSNEFELTFEETYGCSVHGIKDNERWYDPRIVATFDKNLALEQVAKDLIHWSLNTFPKAFWVMSLLFLIRRRTQTLRGKSEFLSILPKQKQTF